MLQRLKVLLCNLQYLNENDWINKLENTLATIQANNSQYSTQIQARKHGEHGIVTVVFNDSVEAKLLIDTGASYIALDDKIMSQLDYKTLEANVLFNTANGKKQAAIVELASMQLGNIRLKNIKVGSSRGYKLSNKNFDGLLGSNILNQFHWRYDAETAVLYLKPLP